MFPRVLPPRFRERYDLLATKIPSCAKTTVAASPNGQRSPTGWSGSVSLDMIAPIWHSLRRWLSPTSDAPRAVPSARLPVSFFLRHRLQAACAWRLRTPLRSLRRARLLLRNNSAEWKAESMRCDAQSRETSHLAGAACFPRRRNPRGEWPCNRARHLTRPVQPRAPPADTIPENLPRGAE